MFNKSRLNYLENKVDLLILAVQELQQHEQGNAKLRQQLSSSMDKAHVSQIGVCPECKTQSFVHDRCFQCGFPRIQESSGLTDMTSKNSIVTNIDGN